MSRAVDWMVEGSDTTTAARLDSVVLSAAKLVKLLPPRTVFYACPAVRYGAYHCSGTRGPRDWLVRAIVGLWRRRVAGLRLRVGRLGLVARLVVRRCGKRGEKVDRGK